MDLRVETASLRKQSLRDAPADVTVVTAAEIRRFGYRTLSEVLQNVRGFYITHDGGFQYAGVRGFSLPGDYNTRFLVMINGHQMTDNIYGAMYMFGQDFGLDMDLVEQVEIVRGPSSALYGSNGVFATINIITRAVGTPAIGHKSIGRMSVERGSFDESKALVSTAFSLGRNTRAMVSGSAFHTGGRTTGEIAGIGKEHGYHSFATVSRKGITLTAMFNERRIAVPTGYYGTDLGDTGTTSREGRNFVELVWNRTLASNAAITWRTYYDQYRYDGIYNYLRHAAVRNLDGAAGDWAGTKFVYQQEQTKVGRITLGSEFSADLRNRQYGIDVTSDPADPSISHQHEYLSIRQPDARFALFVQNEWQASPAWTVYIGGRLDVARNNTVLVSPRVAAVHRHETTTYKITYGRAFRNPSTFERYWLPNPDLRAERIHSWEVSREQQISQNISILASTFHYRLGGLIQGVAISDNALQYRNRSQVTSTGVEFELNSQISQRLNTTLSFTGHRIRGVGGQTLENSPERIAQFRASAPFAQKRFSVGGAARYLSSRRTATNEQANSTAVVDLTAIARVGPPQMELQFGVTNLLGTRYFDPLSPEHSLPFFGRAGRAFYVKLTRHGD